MTWSLSISIDAINRYQMLSVAAALRVCGAIDRSLLQLLYVCVVL